MQRPRKAPFCCLGVRTIILLCLVLLLGHKTVFASSGQPLTRLTISDGLAGETVYKTMTDHSGRIWMATSGGVCVFNGKQICSFYLYDERDRTLAVFDICQTRDKTIYASSEQGLYCMKHGSEGFKRILPEIEKPESLLADGDTVYIGGKQGFMLYDGKKLTTRMLGASKNSLDNIVRHYVKTDDGMVWYLSRFNLHRFNPRNGKTSTIVLGDILPEKVVASQFDIVGGKLFLGTKDTGLYVCDLSTSTARHISGIGNKVTSVKRTANGKICVATDGSGAYLIDAKTETIEDKYSMESKGDHALPTNALYYYLRDNEGMNWFGMVSSGLAYSPYSGSLFEPFETAGFSSIGLNVSCYLFNGNECLLGLQNGLYYINRSTNTIKYFSSDNLDGGHIVTNIVYYKGEYYIGTFDGGLCILNPQTMTIRSQTLDGKLYKASIGALAVDSRNRLWIGCSWGVFIHDNDGKLYNFTEQNSQRVSGIIISTTFDSKGNAWLTGRDGISIYSNESNEILANNVFPKDFFYGESWLKGTAGHDGLLFMRNGFGTFYTDREMKRYGELQLPFKFNDRWCRAFVDDLHGHYWVASSKGLFRFDYKLKEMIHFSSGDGLKGDFINDMRLDKDRYLWVGTSDGLFKLKIDKLHQWTNRNHHKVHLYNIWREAEYFPIAKELMVNDSHHISIKWNITSDKLIVDPILLDYAQGTDRLYEYRVDNGQWITLHQGKSIEIDNLSFGTHELEVRLAGFAGTTSLYNISVLPSACAIIELVALILFIVLFIFWNRYRKTNKTLSYERNDIESALIELEEELQNIKNMPEEDASSQTTKYQKVKLDEEECKDIVARMTAYIEDTKIYTNADLKLKDIADTLHLSAPKLSQIFNLYMKENYYDFINRYRLDEFKQLIEAGEHKRVTITALSEKCGFRKSNFYSTFRKVEGMSPAEYLKTKGVKT